MTIAPAAPPSESPARSWLAWLLAGLGLADTRVADVQGTVGRVLQGLVIERRPEAS